ncbi:ABC transporter type 1, transmembrane domain-containing protein [Aspergillus undulatus]|uniref:ABC transporter type 1, transmembrane domain-containing protein n=1 Tax=Aspergillus undulatus TaxID=1810928 RepID=UPI003CCD8109
MDKGGIVEEGTHDELVNGHGSYARMVRAQDLAPGLSGGEDGRGLGSASISDEDEREEEEGPIDRKIWLWFAVTVATCIAGAAVNPGQALLLGNITSVFTSPDLVARGNFISLMLFVMALGILLVYFVMGWCTNTIAQRLSKSLRHSLLASYLSKDLVFFDRPENTLGTLTSRLDSHPRSVLELMGFTVSITLMSALNVLASSTLSVAVSWKLGLLGLVGVSAGLSPALGGGYARVRIEVELDEAFSKRLEGCAGVASETVLAIRTVASLAMEEAVLGRYVSELDRALEGVRRGTFDMMGWFALTQAV